MPSSGDQPLGSQWGDSTESAQWTARHWGAAGDQNQSRQVWCRSRPLSRNQGTVPMGVRGRGRAGVSGGGTAGVSQAGGARAGSRSPQQPRQEGQCGAGGSLLEGVFRETGRESGAGSLGWHGDRGVTGLGSTWRLRRSQRRGVWTRGKFRTSGTEVRVTTGAWVAALRGHGKWTSDPRTPRASGLPSMFNSLPRDQTPQMLQARQL